MSVFMGSVHLSPRFLYILRGFLFFNVVCERHRTDIGARVGALVECVGARIVAGGVSGVMRLAVLVNYRALGNTYGVDSSEKVGGGFALRNLPHIRGSDKS